MAESGGATPRIVDWPARMKEVADFVGFGPAEMTVLQATGPLILQHGEELTSAVYDHFLKFPQSKSFFLTAEGQIDEERLTRRKHSLLRWLRGSIDFKIDADHPIRLLATGIVHSHPLTHRAHLGSIPSRFMIGTISFVQTVLNELFQREIEDRHEALCASLAWNKMLMIQLNILLAGYVIETPTAPLVEESP